MLSEVLPLFPRCVGKGEISADQLKTVHLECGKLFESDEQSDMSHLLAGRLETQIRIPLELPFAQKLKDLFEDSCLQWVEEAKAFWNRGPSKYWEVGTYYAEVCDIWLNKQVAGDYNPVHTHGGDFSGVMYVQVPEQIDGVDHNGALAIHGPECFDLKKFQMGMIRYFKPVEGDFYLFPAWQPHSVMPFKGEGERWSIAFNIEIRYF